MTTTSAPRTNTAQGRGRLPAPVRDRRPALAALALLLVLGGALTSALVAYRSGDRVDVLVARVPIEVGQVVQQSDFGVARVAADGASGIEADAAANFYGTSATTRIPAGTLLNRSMFLAGSGVVPDGATVVGVVLSTGQRPAVELVAGDVVRVYLVPRDAAAGVASGTVLADAVLVAEAPLAAAGGGDTARLSLLVPEQDAVDVVTAAATGSIAVTRLAPETAPAVGFRTQ